MQYLPARSIMANKIGKLRNGEQHEEAVVVME